MKPSEVEIGAEIQLPPGTKIVALHDTGFEEDVEGKLVRRCREVDAATWRMTPAERKTLIIASPVESRRGAYDRHSSLTLWVADDDLRIFERVDGKERRR